jgi:NADH-quinone oxidoreductase subunit F
MKYAIQLGTTTTSALLEGLGVDAAELKAVWFAYPMATFVTPDHFGDEIEVSAAELVTFGPTDCMAHGLLDVCEELRTATDCTCTFGHEGGYQVVTILGDVCSKKGKPGDLALLRDLCPAMQAHAQCAEGRALAGAVLQALDLFGPEIEAHITKKSCPSGGCPAFQTYHILVSKCTGCGKCLKACDDKAIMGKAKFVHVIDQRKCTQCDQCRQACPEGAVVRAGAKKPKTPPRPIPCKRKK